MAALVDSMYNYKTANVTQYTNPSFSVVRSFCTKREEPVIRVQIANKSCV